MSPWAVACVVLVADAGAPPPFRWESPPRAFAAAEGAGEVEASGVATRLQTVWVKGDPEEVGRFYVESFERQGLYVAQGQHYDTAVTGYDPVRERSYSVVLRRAKKGLVQVLLGEADVGRRRSVRADEVGPVLPGASEVLVVKDEGVASVTYRAKESPAEVDAFYRAVLKGYREVQPGVFEGAERYVLKRHAEAKDGGTTVRLERRPREAH